MDGRNGIGSYARGMGPAVGRLLLMLGLAGVLAACSAFEREENRKCPQVRIDSTTSSITEYRPGPGRDITDIVVEAELAGFTGECGYVSDGMELTLAPQFEVFIGPAAVERTVSIRYFVAIPAFHPDPSAKNIFDSTVTLPINIARGTFSGEEISVFIPLNKTETAEFMDIYLGFQLTQEQLRHNRERGRL